MYHTDSMTEKKHPVLEKNSASHTVYACSSGRNDKTCAICYIIQTRCCEKRAPCCENRHKCIHHIAFTQQNKNYECAICKYCETKTLWQHMHTVCTILVTICI